MWYFAWMLGLGFACALGILNAMWLELNCDLDAPEAAPAGDRVSERFSSWRRH